MRESPGEARLDKPPSAGSPAHTLTNTHKSKAAMKTKQTKKKGSRLRAVMFAQNTNQAVREREKSSVPTRTSSEKKIEKKSSSTPSNHI